MSLVTDKNNPCLNVEQKNGQNECYLVLTDEDLKKGFIRPVRESYIHTRCGGLTTMGRKISETYATDPTFYGSTFCIDCKEHFPVDEFTWSGTDIKVGS